MSVVNSCLIIDVTVLLTFLAQASHELIPPEVSPLMSDNNSDVLTF